MYFCCYLNEEAAETCKDILQWVTLCQIKDADYLYRVTMGNCQFMTENFGDVIMSYPRFWLYLGEIFELLKRQYCITKVERAEARPDPRYGFQYQPQYQQEPNYDNHDDEEF